MCLRLQGWHARRDSSVFNEILLSRQKIKTLRENVFPSPFGSLWICKGHIEIGYRLFTWEAPDNERRPQTHLCTVTWPLPRRTYRTSPHPSIGGSQGQQRHRSSPTALTRWIMDETQSLRKCAANTHVGVRLPGLRTWCLVSCSDSQIHRWLAMRATPIKSNRTGKWA